LAELHRVLKPDGRYVIIDTDWDSMVFHSVDPALTSRILGIFEGHLADAHLPRTLGSKLRAKNLSVSRIEPFVQMSPGNADAYAKALTKLISDYVRDKGGLTNADVDGWEQGLNTLESSNEAFMSLNQFFFTGHKT
jgi:ubiquinone/menaquinone biosynthesis C-methylase UbiE